MFNAGGDVDPGILGGLAPVTARTHPKAPAPTTTTPVVVPKKRDLPGFALLALALASLGLLVSGDPYDLSLPAAAIGTGISAWRLRQGRGAAPTLIALNVGLGALLLWIVLQGLLGLIMGLDVLHLPSFTIHE